MCVPFRHLIITISAVLVMMAGISGCSPPGPVWVNESTAYTSRSVSAVMDDADISRLSGRPTSDAPGLRHDALAAMRREGDAAARIADVLTSTFEPDTRGVPVYVERAFVDGSEAVIVVEATGPKSGKLTSKRLWVLDPKGDVILALSR